MEPFFSKGHCTVWEMLKVFQLLSPSVLCSVNEYYLKDSLLLTASAHKSSRTTDHAHLCHWAVG